MTRKRFDIIDVIVALIIGVVLGIFATFCFSSPSSEARFETIDGVESGFIESNRIRSGSNPVGAGFLAKVVPPAPIFTVTAYCPNSCCCGEFADGITASGEPAKGFFVAAPPEYPFWTYLTIEGYAGGLPVPVLDRGGKIKGNRFDVFFGGKNGHERALAWGVKYLKARRIYAP